MPLVLGYVCFWFSYVTFSAIFCLIGVVLCHYMPLPKSITPIKGDDVDTLTTSILATQTSVVVELRSEALLPDTRKSWSLQILMVIEASVFFSWKYKSSTSFSQDFLRRHTPFVESSFCFL